MSLANKHKQWVLDTVDRLRQRKARPDLERISRMVERLHGLTHTETKESLDKLCDDGVVIKVYFKGNVSYRHIRNNDKGANHPNSLYNTSSRIVTAIKLIMKQTGDGVSFENLEQWLISKNPETRLVKHRLSKALEREIERGNVTKLSDNCYVLTESLPKDKPKQEPLGFEVNSNERSEKSLSEKTVPMSTPTAKSEVKTKDKIAKTSNPVIDKKAPVKSESKGSEVKVKEKIKTAPATPEKNNSQSSETRESIQTKEQQRRGRPLSKRKVLRSSWTCCDS